MLTRIIYKVAFRKRVREISRYATKAAELQQEQLSFLLKRGSRTAFGRKYALSGDCSYEKFSSKVPLQTYDEIKPHLTKYGKSLLVENEDEDEEEDKDNEED